MTNDASIVHNLQYGQFIGVFNCSIAMRVCLNQNNDSIDCYRGDATAQILLFAYNRYGNAKVRRFILMRKGQKTIHK